MKLLRRNLEHETWLIIMQEDSGNIFRVSLKIMRNDEAMNDESG